MLRSIYRFHGHGSLRYVYSKGAATRNRYMTCKYVKGRRAKPRVAVVISKKVLKSAVGRNRIRRRVFEIVREQLPFIEPRSDIALIITAPDVGTIEHTELKGLIHQLFEQANLYKKQ